MMLRTLALACVLFTADSRRAVKEYTINLDLPPQERFVDTGMLDQFNTTVWKFYDDYFANDAALRDAFYGLVLKRGKEPAEMEAEIEGLAAASKLPVLFVRGVQMLYEIQTTMVPLVNISGAPKQNPLPKGLEVLGRIPWRGPGCTGIIATCSDGVVYHARNLDFSPVPIMTDLVYTGIFTKGGKEIFRSQMIAGYQQIITAMRMGPNGYAIERNTRYPDHTKGNDQMFENLLGGKPLNGWLLRKIVEENADYDGAIKAIASAPYVSTEYAIVSGVKKGTILSKNAAEDGEPPVAYTQTLGEKNFDERDDYIIMTNFDFFHHDVREYFDPTGGQVGHPRRVAAQSLLNSTTSLTPEFLYETINAKGVIADTIFQAVMSPEKGYWNVSCPDL